MRNGNTLVRLETKTHLTSFGCPYEEWKHDLSQEPPVKPQLSDVPMRNGNYFRPRGSLRPKLLSDVPMRNGNLYMNRHINPGSMMDPIVKTIF